MKIVTYNVNGLRPRIAQFGSLLKLLNSFDADIICFQETKLSRQDLTANLVMADGYESFFSCTRTTGQGRVGYSGVATFCRVNSAFSSNEVALPLAAEEGFTGLLENSRGFGTRKDEIPATVGGLEGFAKEELLKVDSEGRCIITDHDHFVLFNIYGPRADCDDTERIQFKLTFFKILQKRWESFLDQGRRILLVGDLNIAPASIDRCDAGPDFEKNEFRRWFRSILVESGGQFFDVFRAKHPERKEAYTCWASSTGAEEFNYGSRIDHILISRSCLHQELNMQGHDFMTCHVKECDILLQFKRWKPGNTPRHMWKGGKTIKLEGSDHVPVCMSLMDVPDTPEHNTPTLSARYDPVIRGCQQTIVSVLMKRLVAERAKNEVSSPFPDSNINTESFGENVRSSFTECGASCFPSDASPTTSNPESEIVIPSTNSHARGCTSKRSENTKATTPTSAKKKARQSQYSQLSLKSFFQKTTNQGDGIESSSTDISLDQSDVLKHNHDSQETPTGDDDDESNNNHKQQPELNLSVSSQDRSELNVCGSLENEKNNVALLEWRRIQQLMQNSIPLCKGHNEPCVLRVVKKAGPNLGRRFYSCARAEGPAFNPETNCKYFKWAASKSKHT